MRTFALLIRFLIVPLSIGFLLALTASALVQLYAQSQEDTRSARSLTEIMLGLRSNSYYVAPLTVLDYDPESRALLISLVSDIIGQEVPQLLVLGDNFTAERRDVIVQDGVIVGSQPLTSVPSDELKEGVRGLGVLHLTDSGTTQLDYLLIGEPFPRP